MAGRIRTYHELEASSSDLGEQVAAQEARVAARLADVGSVIAVTSGKGGVGKSLVTSLLATAWAAEGRRVGVVDADMNGPTVARLLGVDAPELSDHGDAIEPPLSPAGVRVMSMALLLDSERGLAWREPGSASFVWRGAQERAALREFLADVRWDRLDALLVDAPPGTQRLVELHELVPDLAGAVTVTLPSSAARDAVGRGLDLARRRGVRLLGLVENMAGYACGACGTRGELFPGGAADELAARFEVTVLARLSFDPALAAAADAGDLERWLSGKTAGAGEARALARRCAEAVDAARGEVP